MIVVRCFIRVLVVQWIERPFPKRKAAGSTPAESTRVASLVELVHNARSTPERSAVRIRQEAHSTQKEMQ